MCYAAVGTFSTLAFLHHEIKSILPRVWLCSFRERATEGDCGLNRAEIKGLNLNNRAHAKREFNGASTHHLCSKLTSNISMIREDVQAGMQNATYYKPFLT